MLPQSVLAICFRQPLGDGKALLICLPGGPDVAIRQVRIAELVQHRSPAPLNIQIIGSRSSELLESRFGGIKNLAYGVDAHALHMAQPLSNIEHQTVRSPLRQLEIT